MHSCVSRILGPSSPALASRHVAVSFHLTRGSARAVLLVSGPCRCQPYLNTSFRETTVCGWTKATKNWKPQAFHCCDSSCSLPASREREKVGFRIEAVVRSEEPRLARPPGSLVPFAKAGTAKLQAEVEGLGLAGCYCGKV